jgi:hydroxypyruvate isomerase
MPRFAANISLMYPEHALADRIAAAAHDGFAAVEVQAPYAVGAGEFRRALDDARIEVVLMNAPPGDASAGEAGLAALPGRESDFESSIAVALDYAREVGAPRIHVMAGRPGPEVLHADALAAYEHNLAHACDTLVAHGIGVTIEVINPRDVPGFFLNRLSLATEVIARVNRPNLALQFDFYHLQIIEGDLATRFAEALPVVGHVQIAGVPQRHEPDTGEVHYPYLFSLIDRLGYRGWVGCEYRPARTEPGGTCAGLGWLRRA